MRTFHRPIIYITVAAACLSHFGCQPKMYVPDRATRAYPVDRHTTQTVDMQVFRSGPRIEIVNATANSYHDFDLWVNRRYVHHIEALPAGESLTLSLWDFFDERGERFNAGGFFRTTEPTPVRLVQIEQSPESPLVGLIAIPEIDTVRQD